MPVTTSDTAKAKKPANNPEKTDGRKHNRGTIGNKGGRPVKNPGAKMNVTTRLEVAVIEAVKLRFGSIADGLRYLANLPE